MRSWSLFMLALLALTALSGCLGPVQDHVPCAQTGPVGASWDDPGFVHRLQGLDAAGWSVEYEPRPVGFPIHDARVVAWNASVVTVGLSAFPQPGGVKLDAAGWLTLETQGPRANASRDAVDALLEEVTDADEAQRAAWFDALAANGTVAPGYGDGRDPERLPWEYRSRIPWRAANADRVLAHLDLDAPRRSVSHDGWSASFAFDVASATNGTATLRATGELNVYEYAWPAGTTHEEAVAGFRDTVRGLGLGELPEDVNTEWYSCLE